MIPRKKIEGIVLLALAALFFWLPHYMQGARLADGKILVASPQLAGGIFQGSVVLVVKHDGYGAIGFIVNRPAVNPSDPAIGGPVDESQLSTLHSLDISDKTTEKTRNLNLGVTQGADFIYNLGKRERKPQEYIVFKGYASWGPLQLEQELERGGWKMIDFDRTLVFQTPPDKMYNMASSRPSSN